MSNQMLAYKTVFSAVLLWSLFSRSYAGRAQLQTLIHNPNKAWDKHNIVPTAQVILPSDWTASGSQTLLISRGAFMTSDVVPSRTVVMAFRDPTSSRRASRFIAQKTGDFYTTNHNNDT